MGNRKVFSSTLYKSSEGRLKASVETYAWRGKHSNGFAKHFGNDLCHCSDTIDTVCT